MNDDAPLLYAYAKHLTVPREQAHERVQGFSALGTPVGSNGVPLKTIHELHGVARPTPPEPSLSWNPWMLKRY
jgi:hypothetical protein